MEEEPGGKDSGPQCCSMGPGGYRARSGSTPDTGIRRNRLWWNMEGRMLTVAREELHTGDTVWARPTVSWCHHLAKQLGSCRKEAQCWHESHSVSSKSKVRARKTPKGWPRTSGHLKCLASSLSKGRWPLEIHSPNMVLVLLATTVGTLLPAFLLSPAILSGLRERVKVGD